MPGDDANTQGFTGMPGAADHSSEPVTGADAPGAPARDLPVGARVGDYTITRVLSGGSPPHYLAVKAAAASADLDASAQASAAHDAPLEQLVELLAGDPGAFEGARAIIRRNPHHAHLLAPRAIVAWDGRDYLVVDACEAPGEAVAPPDAITVLAAGADLAGALTYLHREGVAHQRVSPEAVVFCGGSAYLTGLWHAQPIHPSDRDAPALFARDANFLARTLGALAPGSSNAASGPDASDPGAAALAALVERAETSGFDTPAQVGEACAAALPPGASARGADLLGRPVAGVATMPIASRSAASAPIAPGEQPAASARSVAATGAQLRFTVATAASVGRVRAENQDAAGVLLFEVHDDPHAGIVGTMPAGLFLIADGMGGEERGDLASRIAARTMLADVARRLMIPALEEPAQAARAGVSDAEVMLPNLAETLIQAGRAANAEVRALAALLGKTTGSTLTAIVAVGARAAFVHIGDSRAYLLRQGELSQLTEDHTLLARLEKMRHPLLQEPGFLVPRSYLYRSLGQEDAIDLDSGALTLASGDRLLLCSDGLWDEVDGGRIAGLLAGAATAQEGADALVRAANDHGGNDNSSVVVVFVGEQSAIA
jgi:protein phosphatase